MNGHKGVYRFFAQLGRTEDPRISLVTYVLWAILERLVKSFQELSFLRSVFVFELQHKLAFTLRLDHWA